MLYKDNKTGKIYSSKKAYYAEMAKNKDIAKFRRARYKQLSKKKIII